MRKPSVLVIGAGIGGLVAALELAARGLAVTVLERAAHVGGKMREVIVDGESMDAGPTVFTMRWVFDELLDAIGETLDTQLGLQPLHTLARHVWREGERLDLFTDIERSVDAIAGLAGPAEARRYRAFCARARAVYDTLEQPFLRGTRPNPVSLLARAGLPGLPGLLRISPFTTLWQTLGEHFHDPRLRQLFGRNATYCGSSPFLAPATLMLVAHVERSGVWRVQGGMHRVAQMLQRLAEARGARLRFGAEVRRIVVQQGRARGVELTSGETLLADAVVFNGDAAALSAGLLGDAAQRALPPSPGAARSLSAITWNLVARTEGLPLLHHTVFFSKDYAAEFDALVNRGELAAQPTVYVCAQDRGESAGALPSEPERGPERLLCLVNAPARGDHAPLCEQEIQRCEQQTFARLAQCGLRIERTPQRSVLTTPTDFHRLFPATGGALYGAASHGWRASFNRPTQQTAIPGLVLAGGSTHPGPGVPMAALSGRLAAATVLAQLKTLRVSMSMLPRADTPGGTSMR